MREDQEEMEPARRTEQTTGKSTLAPSLRRWLALVGPLAVGLLAAVLFLRDTAGRDVFSWMDPWQYFGMGRALAEGAAPAGGFEVPTIFPLFIAPFLALDLSVAGALLTNLVFLLVIFGGTLWLVRELDLDEPLGLGSTLALILLLASPLLFGLSRELYSETALTAMVTLAFGFWLRWLRTGGWGALAGLAVFAGFAVAVKITAPLFFIGPFVGVTIWLLSRKRWSAWLALCGAFAVGFGLALGGLWLTMPNARPYFLSLGNTEIPIMHLIGPPERWSWESVLYYPGVMILFGLWTGLTLIVGPLRLFQAFRDKESFFRRAMLWLWVLTPPLILILQETKEPRHILPCLVPVVLLLLDGLKTKGGWQPGLIGLLVTMILGNVVLSLPPGSEPPYALKSDTRFPALLGELQEIAPPKADDEVLQRPPLPLWAYRRNIVITGFDADEALALAWLLRPGVVIDLDSYGRHGQTAPGLPAVRYEDPFVYSVFDIYNRRIGYPANLTLLTRDEVLANADILISGSALEPAANPFSGELAPLEARVFMGMSILLMPPAEATYREIYNERWLAELAQRVPPVITGPVEDAELLEDLAILRAIRRDLTTEFLLTTDAATLENADRRRQLWGLPERYPALFEPEGLDEIVAAKPLYWFGVYGNIEAWRSSRLDALVPPTGLIRDRTRERIDAIYEDPTPVSGPGVDVAMGL